MARPSTRQRRERAIRMVAETKGDYPSEFAAIESVARKLGPGRDAAQVDPPGRVTLGSGRA
jgi:hypothetical protein